MPDADADAAAVAEDDNNDLPFDKFNFTREASNSLHRIKS